MSGNTITLIPVEGTTDAWPFELFIEHHVGSLQGIYATNAYKTDLSRNYITGTNALQTANREDIAGICLNNSKQFAISCNTMNNTRFGLLGISNCETDNKLVQGNLMHKQILGWAFRHLGDEGTLGQVGKPDRDNNNRFTNNLTSNKVFKFCESSQGFKIFTDQLSLGDFNSYKASTQDPNHPCDYKYQNNSGVLTFECPITPLYY
jgi:hypothetical protein